jgi:O-methyltransferase involved in polyketide biosynthesis
VYVDNDPVVLLHARSLLTTSPEGATAYVEGDLHDPEHILEQAAETLDLSKPVAITLLAILEFVPELAVAKSIVDRLLAAVPSGSYLAISAPVHGEAMDEAARLWNASGASQVTIRSHDEQLSLFDGLELLEPGLVQLPQWRPEFATRYQKREFPYVGGVARKP